MMNEKKETVYIDIGQPSDGWISNDQGGDSFISADLMKKLPSLLRIFGALAVLFSLYNFFARGWEGSSDLIRYMMLLGHTGALAAIGLASGHYLKEGKSARLLLVLAQISVVACFTILGAFIFASLNTVLLGAVPNYLTWSAGNLVTALIAAASSLVVLVPVIKIGFLTLARGVSNRMTMLFLIGNGALLLPVRETVMVAGLTFATAVVLLASSGKGLRNSTEVKTYEGMAALALLFVPVGVLLVRNLWLYSPDHMLYSVTAFTSFIAVRQLSLFLDGKSPVRVLTEQVSVLLAGATGVGIFNTLVTGTGNYSLALISATVTTAAMIYDISGRSVEYAAGFRSIAIAVLVTGIGVNQYVYGGLLTSLVTISIGLALIAISYIVQQRSALYGGVVLFIGGMIEHIIHAFQAFDLGYWAALAIIGVLAIVIASVLESNSGKQLKDRFIEMKSRYSEWSF